MAPIMIQNTAILALILMLKWMLIAIKNINTADEPIMWILALNFKTASIKHVSVESNIPTKKQYNSISSVYGKTR